MYNYASRGRGAGDVALDTERVAGGLNSHSPDALDHIN